LDDCVEISYQGYGGDTRRIRGKYLVGSDGKTGFTRKKYLEPRGVLMQQSSR
jgi:2-polyprenyl-6-methoxyphenol hydroxylase-like FAD-dependent oxidoreductase